MGQDLFDPLVITVGNEAMKSKWKCFDAFKEAGIDASEGLKSWIESPVSATIKLDGTNVGIDNEGMMVGRNMIIDKDNYQKCNVKELLKGYQPKMVQVLDELQKVCTKPLKQAMGYGELMVNGIHDYEASGIFKKWLCFGIALRTEDNNDEVAKELRANGFLAHAHRDGPLTVTPNDNL